MSSYVACEDRECRVGRLILRNLIRIKAVGEKRDSDALINGRPAMAGRTSREEGETTPPKNVDNLQQPIASTSTSTSTSSISESTNNDVANKEEPAIEERFFVKMLPYEIVCFVLAITFTALAALHNS